MPGVLERFLHSRVARSVTAAIAVLVCLGIAWGWDADKSFGLPMDSHALPRGGEIEPLGEPDPLPEDAIGLMAEIGTYSEYPLERAIAYSIGLLHRMDVPLGADSMSFETASVYVVRSGDTWESVADRLLGDGRLWPILALLNPAEARLGELLTDHVLRVPESEKLP